MAMILLAEDRAVDRQFLATLIGYFGHVVIEAGDGAQALGLVRRRRPDLVISDVLMSTMDGYEFVRQMRAIPEVAHTAVIFCTATYHEREVRTLAERCGVSDIITKPCEPEVILRKIDAVLARVCAGKAAQPDTAQFLTDHARVVNEKLMEKMRRLAESELRLSALVDMGRRISSEPDPLALLQQVCHSAREVTLASHAALALLSEDATSLRNVAMSGIAPIRLAAVGAASLRGEALSVMLEKRRPIRSPSPPCLGVPVASPARVYGWLTLTNKLGADDFSEMDEQMAIALGGQAGVAYENAWLYEEAQLHLAVLKQEVAERKSVEEELRRAKDRTEFALAAVHMGIGETDLASGSEFWSESKAALFGISVEAFAGTIDGFYELVHADDRTDVKQAFEAALASGGSDFTAEFRTMWPDATTHWVHNRARIYRDAAGRPVRLLGVALDLTERKLLEAQFHQAQKMDAIGLLASGVAHDFNTLLTVIRGYAQSLGDDTLSDRQRHDVEEIVDASDRAAALTRQLLAFSRQQAMQPTVIDVNALVKGISRMLMRVIGEHIELTTTLAPDLAQVRADGGQIEQVVINLIVNARDALTEGGGISIKTANVTVGAGETIRNVDVKPGPYVTIAVTDTGCGMDEKTLERLFEPFFTTKKRGKGTGLGLATVDGIVNQSGGHVNVTSELLYGSSFTVYLPCAEPAADVDAVVTAPHGGASELMRS